MTQPDIPSTRPYLIRALYEWCTDNGFTPYLAVVVDGSVQVPREFVKNNEIVLNIGFDATSSLKLGDEWIEFKARFAGSAREIMVPVTHVSAIYARENGQGMAFPINPLPSTPSISSVASSVKPLAVVEKNSLGISVINQAESNVDKVAGLLKPVSARRKTSGKSSLGNKGVNITEDVLPAEGESNPETSQHSPKLPVPGRPALKRIK